MSDGEKGEPAVRVIDRRWWARNEESAAADETIRKPTVVEELEQRLAESTAQLQAVIGEYRRSSEEFEQVKLRMRREVGKEVERGRRTLLADLLEVVDNLDRAVAAVSAPDAGHEGTSTTIARGVELVRDQFLAKLESFGVARVPVLGQPFDASWHEAVTTTPVDAAAQDGHVVAVLKEGYAIGDEVLRPASVVVGKANV
jgi:molecular chaperone GrpE